TTPFLLPTAIHWGLVAPCCHAASRSEQARRTAQTRSPSLWRSRDDVQIIPLAFRRGLAGLHWPAASTFLVLMLLGDLAFIGLHFVDELLFPIGDGLGQLDMDRGYGEMFQYQKYLWIIALLIVLTVKRRAFQYIS